MGVGQHAATASPKGHTGRVCSLLPMPSVSLPGRPCAAYPTHPPLQAGVEDTPEHLSFSLWDPALQPGGATLPAFPQAQQPARPLSSSSALQGAEQASLTSLQAFGGFPAGYVRSSASGPGPQVFDLTSGAAERLLAQHARQTEAVLVPVSRPLVVGAAPAGAAERETAREARLTLLRAWVNAAAATAQGPSASADGGQGSSLLQPVDGRVGRLSSRGLALIAQDVASVLSLGDVALLAQHLSGLLKN